MGKIIIVSISMFILISMLPLVTIAESPANPRKGKYLYRKNCLKCHKFGSENQLGPDSKKRVEWEKIFSKESLPLIPCTKEWASLSKKDIKDIAAHMHSHASDSPAPAACR